MSNDRSSNRRRIISSSTKSVVVVVKAETVAAEEAGVVIVKEISAAVKNKNMQMVSALLKFDASINKRDHYGYTPLMAACLIKERKMS
jgi:hypothetical protein